MHIGNGQKRTVSLQRLLVSAIVSILLFTTLLELLPHLLTMVFFSIYALFPSAREHLEPFGGFTGYMRGNLLPRFYQALFSAYTWRLSWLWAILGAGVCMVQHAFPHGSRGHSMWFWGTVMVLASWYVLAYRVWNDPFHGILSTVLLIGGIVLLWRYILPICERLEEWFR